VQLESVGWGWLVTEATTADLSEASSLEADPYASQKAQADDTQEYTCSTRWTLNSVMTFPQTVIRAIVVNTLIVAALVLGILYDPRYLVLILVALCYGPLQFVFINTRQFFISVHHVLCDRNGIQVKYRFRRLAGRQSWTEIREMELRDDLDETCLIRSDGNSLQFSSKGLKEKPIFVKTIVERASLHFVQVGDYKRSDAQ
jgi:hypothetical protein